MSFRDDEQAARACRALLGKVRLARLWTRSGPTDHAIHLLEQDGGPLSSGERLVVLSAFALWNGRGGVRLSDIIESLDVNMCESLFELIVAMRHGSRFVDDWLADNDVPEEH